MNSKLIEFDKRLSSSKIAIIGAGVSNVPLFKYLADLNCDITLFDKREYDEFDDSIKEIVDNYEVSMSLGSDYLTKLVGYDIIFRSPSCLPNNEYLVKEKERGALVTTEVEQVIRLTPSKTIGITGSKGKTTTTTITNEILKKLGYKTYLGGNIGTPLFTSIKDMTSDDIVVLELSSFQLMDMVMSPSISVVTNISPDHLDIHGSYQEYINAKKYIYLNQDKDDVVILNGDDLIVSKFSDDVKGSIRYFGSTYYEDSYILDGKYITYNGDKVIDTSKLELKGKHNYLNICASLNAIKDFINVSNEELESIIKDIKSVHHRLEFVREINGVKWYNDSASTTPDKSMGGLNAFDGEIVLIAGGYDKNISYESMARPILDHVSKLILFGDTKNKIYDAVMDLKKKENSDIQIYVMDTLDEVIDVAYQVSVSGEVVLFSPASASFDMFKNAYQRGDIFKEKVNKL